MINFFQNHRKTGVAVLAGIVLLIIFGIAFWFAGWGFIAALETLTRPLLPLLVVVGIPLAITAFFGLKAYYGVSRRSGLFTTLAVVGAVGAIAGTVYLGARLSYENDQIYSQNIKTVEVTSNYADRAPWTVANNYAQRDQGDIVGERDAAHYVPAPTDAQAEDGVGTSRYTVLIEGRAPLAQTGYAGVQTLNMPTTGTLPSGVSSTCTTPENMDKRLGNFWHQHNLGVDIAAQRPNAHYSKDDVYGYCDGDSPVIVVPLWKYEGVWHVTKAPAGIAVYTEDGVKVYDEAETAKLDIQGPTYPRSLAEIQRSSINGSGTWGEWFGKSYGYETTEKDDEDANKDNTTEFTMISGDGKMDFVTPLTPRGSSQSMTALAEIGAVQTGKGRNEVVINTSPQLPATSTITTSIKESSVHGDSNWSTRWSSGMAVYEILPGKDGHWVASIGQGQAVSYRADIAPDGSVTVTNSDTGASSGEGTDTTTESVTVPGSKPLSEMSDAELLDQIDQATTELQRRQTDG